MNPQMNGFIYYIIILNTMRSNFGGIYRHQRWRCRRSRLCRIYFLGYLRRRRSAVRRVVRRLADWPGQSSVSICLDFKYPKCDIPVARRRRHHSLVPAYALHFERPGTRASLAISRQFSFCSRRRIESQHRRQKICAR